MKKAIIIIIVIMVLVGGYFIVKNFSNKTELTESPGATVTPIPRATVTPLVDAKVKDEDKTVIGTSALGRDITAYHFGKGDTELLFVGGIHGGYAWNTVLLAYEAMDFFQKNQTVIPENVKVTIIPILNPDGLNKVVGTTTRFSRAEVPSSETTLASGRFNGNTVDLNRNFDCDWKSEAKWQNKIVSGGGSAFSEPESQAIKNYIEAQNPKAVVVWYSAAGGVFASNCHNGVLSETTMLTDIYSNASGYPAYENFDFYEITGDMVNWLAKENIPAISVLLTNHTDTEWTKNQRGIEALLKHYTR